MTDGALDKVKAAIEDRKEWKVAEKKLDDTLAFNSLKLRRRIIVDKLYSLFTERIDRIFLLGRTTLGYPMHTGAHGFKELQRITDVDLILALSMHGYE